MPEHLPHVAISADCHVHLVGRQEAAVFAQYKDFLKNNLRARYDAERTAWRIQPNQIDMVAKHFEGLGFSVTMPRGPISCIKPKIEVRLRYAEGKIRFNCCERSEMFNEIFNNKSGMLTGITEYLPDTYERATTSFYLAKEAIAVLEEQDFKVVQEQSYVSTLAFWQAREDGFKTMDPSIAELLASELSLFHHQNKAVARIEKAQGKFLLGAAMGSGKTIIALAYAAKHRLRVCIVCPKVVRRNWLKEAQKFFPSSFLVGQELDKRKGPTELSRFDVVSVNYEGLSKWSSDIIEGQFDMLVVDESHYCKNPDSVRTSTLLKLSKHFEHRLLLSGTAIKNKREELQPQLEMLDAETYGPSSGLFSAPTGAFWHGIQHIYMAMPKNEVLPFLPAKTVRRHDVTVDEPVDLPSSIEEVMLYKHMCAKSKLSATFDKIRYVIENSDDAILVFSEFVDIAQEIHREFKNISLYHDGQMSNDKREQVKELFQSSGGPRILVSTRPSLAVGATLTRASHVIFNDLPWNPADIDQAADRCVGRGTRVLTPTGYRSIEEIAIGDFVIGKSGKICAVTDAWHGGKKPVFEITVKGAPNAIFATVDHQFLTANGWTRTDALVTTSRKPRKQASVFSVIENNSVNVDYMDTEHGGTKKSWSRKKAFPNRLKLNEEALFVFGYYIGDGFCRYGNDCGCFVSMAGNDYSKNISLSRCREWFRKKGITCNTRHEKMKRGVELRFFSKRAALFFSSKFGRTLKDKRIPRELLSLSNEQSLWLMNGLLASDGYIRNNYAEYICSHEHLACNVLLLALRCGFRPSLRKQITGQFVVGFSLTKADNRPRTPLVVESVKAAGEMDVFDITVDGDESFLLENGVIAHNCHRIGQSKPVFVHWVIAENSAFDMRLIDLISKKYTIQKAVTEGKQVSKEEMEFLAKPISFRELLKGAKETKYA